MWWNSGNNPHKQFGVRGTKRFLGVVVGSPMLGEKSLRAGLYNAKVSHIVIENGLAIERGGRRRTLPDVFFADRTCSRVL